MENISNGYGIVKDLLDGKLFFILSYGETSEMHYDIKLDELVSAGLYKFKKFSMNTCDNEKLLPEEKLNMSDLESIYNYMHGENNNDNMLGLPNVVMHYLKLSDEVVFEGPTNEIYIPLSEVIRIFNYKTVRDNTIAVAKIENFHIKYVEKSMEEWAKNPAGIKERDYGLYTSTLKSIDVNDAKVSSTTKLGDNYKIVPLAKTVNATYSLASSPEYILEEELNEEVYDNDNNYKDKQDHYERRENKDKHKASTLLMKKRNRRKEEVNRKKYFNKHA